MASISPGNIISDIEAINKIPVIADLLNVICSTTGMRFAAVARVTDEKWITCITHDEIDFGLKPGDELKLETTLCNEIRQSGVAIIIDHVAKDPAFATHHTPAMYGFESYISVPIKKKDGSFFGTLCAIDPLPNKLRTATVTNMFNMYAELIAFHLGVIADTNADELKMQTERTLHKKIEENEEKLNVVIEAHGLGTWELNMLTQEMQYSEKFPEIMGLIGQVPSWEMLRTRIHSSDIKKREEAYKIAFETGKLHFTGRVVWPDETIHWIESRAKVFFGENGKPLKMTGAVRDITTEKEFSQMLEKEVKERTKQLNEKNTELEKMNKELQSFTYISGHDLQEPLRKIQSFAAMIEKEHPQFSDKVKDYFGRMQRAAERMQLLITDLLAYSRTSTEERVFKPVQMSEIVSQVKDDMKEEIQQKNAVLETEGLCVVNIIPFQMRQLFQNLIANALKFSHSARVPHITIKSKIGDGRDMEHPQAEDDIQYCRLIVKDNGIGFESLYNEKIFEVFQRLHGKAAYHGTGIGLAIVKKIVENHRGFINAEGKPGEGAVFTIWLPLDN